VPKLKANVLIEHFAIDSDSKQLTKCPFHLRGAIAK
jgi:hypothetical protein